MVLKYKTEMGARVISRDSFVKRLHADRDSKVEFGHPKVEGASIIKYLKTTRARETDEQKNESEWVTQVVWSQCVHSVIYTSHRRRQGPDYCWAADYCCILPWAVKMFSGCLENKHFCCLQVYTGSPIIRLQVSVQPKKSLREGMAFFSVTLHWMKVQRVIKKVT